jgi:uncharacterized membrane protein (DUF485 family)
VRDSAEFAELAARRRRLTIALMAVFVVWYGAFLVLAAYARHFMGESIYRGFTVGYLLALSLIAMTWLLAWVYIRVSNKELEPLAQRAAGRAREVERR